MPPSDFDDVVFDGLQNDTESLPRSSPRMKPLAYFNFNFNVTSKADEGGSKHLLERVCMKDGSKASSTTTTPGGDDGAGREVVAAGSKHESEDIRFASQPVKFIF